MNDIPIKLPTSPRAVICPACNAQPGGPCTQPTENSRTAVLWFHHSREALAAGRTA